MTIDIVFIIIWLGLALMQVVFLIKQFKEMKNTRPSFIDILIIIGRLALIGVCIYFATLDRV